jgi:hypothetical protein
MDLENDLPLDGRDDKERLSRPRFFVEEIRQRLADMETVLRRFETERRGGRVVGGN